MLRKIWTIAYRHLYVTFTDRTLLIIMIAVPLVISSIVGLAFGSLFSSGSAPISDIPVALLNRDQATAFGPAFGDFFVNALVPPADSENTSDNPLFQLTDTTLFDAETAQKLVDDGTVDAPEGLDAGSDAYVEAVARAAVDNGTYTALVMIPSDFSAKSTVTPLHQQIEKTDVSVYANSGRGIAASIVRGVVEGITNSLMTGNITVAATTGELLAEGQTQALLTLDYQSIYETASDPSNYTVSVDNQSVGAEAPVDERSGSTAILVQVGSAQAMFFALFTAQFGIFALYDERRNWTLQRLVMTPTPRWVILSGMLVGVFVTVLFQLLVLLVALTLVGSIMQGALVMIWGTNFLSIALVLVTAALAVAGLGMLMAGISRTPEQGQVIGQVVNMALAVLGGAFGFTLPRAVAQFSMLYWGGNAFDMLSSGQGDIGLNVIVLAAQGVVLFAIGLALFNRRFEMA